MNSPRQPPRQVPTLTEVVDVNAHRGTGAPDQPQDAPEAPIAGARAPAGVTEDQLTQRVLADLQMQIDQMLELRLRATLEPALVRLASVMVSDIRDQLAATLHDLVEHAVAEELARYESP